MMMTLLYHLPKQDYVSWQIVYDLLLIFPLKLNNIQDRIVILCMLYINWKLKEYLSETYHDQRLQIIDKANLQRDLHSAPRNLIDIFDDANNTAWCGESMFKLFQTTETKEGQNQSHKQTMDVEKHKENLEQ